MSRNSTKLKKAKKPVRAVKEQKACQGYKKSKSSLGDKKMLGSMLGLKNVQKLISQRARKG